MFRSNLIKKTYDFSVLEANQLSGELPLELGNLPNIQQM